MPLLNEIYFNIFFLKKSAKVVFLLMAGNLKNGYCDNSVLCREGNKAGSTLLTFSY